MTRLEQVLVLCLTNLNRLLVAVLKERNILTRILNLLSNRCLDERWRFKRSELYNTLSAFNFTFWKLGKVGGLFLHLNRDALIIACLIFLSFLCNQSSHVI